MDCACATPDANDCTYDLVDDQTGCVCGCHEPALLYTDDGQPYPCTVCNHHLHEGDTIDALGRCPHCSEESDMPNIIDAVMDEWDADYNADDVTVVKFEIDRALLEAQRHYMHFVANDDDDGYVSGIANLLEHLCHAIDHAGDGPLMLEVKPRKVSLHKHRQAELTRLATVLAEAPGKGEDTERARAAFLAACIEHESIMEGASYTLPGDEGSTTSEINAIITWVTFVVTK